MPRLVAVLRARPVGLDFGGEVGGLPAADPWFLLPTQRVKPEATKAGICLLRLQHACLPVRHFLWYHASLAFFSVTQFTTALTFSFSVLTASPPTRVIYPLYSFSSKMPIWILCNLIHTRLKWRNQRFLFKRGRTHKTTSLHVIKYI